MSTYEFEVKTEHPGDELSELFANTEKGYVNLILKSKNIITLTFLRRIFCRCEWYALAEDLTNEVHDLGIDDLHSVTAQLLSSQPLSSSDETSLSMEDPLHYSSLIPVCRFKAYENDGLIIYWSEQPSGFRCYTRNLRKFIVGWRRRRHRNRNVNGNYSGRKFYFGTGLS